MSSLHSVLSQYEILINTARYLSALDLLHLALANSYFYAIILQSTLVFDRLKVTALCDGTGLIARQNFQALYAVSPEQWNWGRTKKARYDEELEVGVWNLKCDTTDALPCLKCGVNVCEVTPLNHDCSLDQMLSMIQSRNAALFPEFEICLGIAPIGDPIITLQG